MECQGQASSSRSPLVSGAAACRSRRPRCRSRGFEFGKPFLELQQFSKYTLYFQHATALSLPPLSGKEGVLGFGGRAEGRCRSWRTRRRSGSSCGPTRRARAARTTRRRTGPRRPARRPRGLLRGFPASGHSNRRVVRRRIHLNISFFCSPSLR